MISPVILKRRKAVQRWKENNYEYYLLQKRILAHRPEYLAHRRHMYQLKKARSFEHECFLHQNKIDHHELEGKCETCNSECNQLR